MNNPPGSLMVIRLIQNSEPILVLIYLIIMLLDPNRFGRDEFLNPMDS